MDKLQLGVGREIITPPVGGHLYGYRRDLFSESVADDLTATAFYFRQGDACAVMVSATVCLIQTELCGRIRDLLSQLLGIPREVCLVCATHTHSGPDTGGSAGWGDLDVEYCETIFIPRILAAAEAARASARPVKMGVGRAESLVGVNRLVLKADNTVSNAHNNLGIIDPRMTVLAFRDEEDQPVANIIHYGCHCTAAGSNKEITRDWAGVMTDALERESGAITAFFNGTEGDVGPRLLNGKTTGNLRYAMEHGGVAARDAVNIYKDIFFFAHVDLKAGGKQLQLPRKARPALEDALQQYELYRNRTFNMGLQMKQYLERVIASYETDYQPVESTEISQTVIALGNVVFAGYPYEVFSAIGLRVDNYTPNAAVLSLSCANGNEGYFVTQDAITRGGYEVKIFSSEHLQPPVDDADWHLVTQTVEHVQEILKK